MSGEPDAMMLEIWPETVAFGETVNGVTPAVVVGAAFTEVALCGV